MNPACHQGVAQAGDDWNGVVCVLVKITAPISDNVSWSG